MSKRARNGCRANAGFTLVELIVAAGVVGVAIAMAMGSILSVSTAQRTTETDALATAIMTSVMEEVRSSTSLDALMEYVPPDITGLGLGSSVALTVSCIDAANTEHVLPMSVGAGVPTFPNPAEVRVNIQWMDREGRQMQIQGSTFHRRL